MDKEIPVVDMSKPLAKLNPAETTFATMLRALPERDLRSLLVGLAYGRHVQFIRDAWRRQRDA